MDVFEAVAEPNRRALLDALAERERSAGELVATLPALSQPAVSRHLRVLREVGLVEVRADAQRRIYALRADGLIELDEWIGRYRRYWARHLDALEAHLALDEHLALDDHLAEARSRASGPDTAVATGSVANDGTAANDNAAATADTVDPQGKDGS